MAFADASQVPLPTDQIVFADDAQGKARVESGGMSFYVDDRKVWPRA